MLNVIETLGRYLLVETIASGGMATVYRAKLHGVEGFVKDVAIKKILPHWAENDEFIKMLVDEAKVLVHLNHANIVQVYELNRDDNIYYIVLEFVDGFDLRKITNRLDITRQKIPVPLTLYIIEKICMGLMYAHEKKEGEQIGIVHRDISPQNILISLDGDVKITDFGISKIMGKAGDTTVGMLKGKFTYMSPEQALGHPVDPRSDIFSLGIVFYELITGHRLFKGINDIEILNAVRNCAIEKKYLDEAGIDEKLKNIILKTLAQNPEDRYASIRLLYRDLREFQFEKRYIATGLELKYFLQDIFGEELLEKTKRHREESKATVLHDLTRLEVAADVSRKTRVLVKSDLSDVSDKSDQSQKKIIFKIAAGFLIAASLVLGIVSLFKKETPLSPVAVPETIATASVPAPGVERPQPTPQPQTFNARVKVSVEPQGASVELVQGKNKIKLTSGEWVALEKLVGDQEYTLSVYHPEYRSQQETIILSPTQNEIQKTYTLEKLETGFITVSALPWGKVFLAGVIRGSSTPLRSQKVPVGTHTLSISSPDGKIKSSTRVTISKAKNVRCQVNFSQKTDSKKAPAILCQDS